MNDEIWKRVDEFDQEDLPILKIDLVVPQEYLPESDQWEGVVYIAVGEVVVKNFLS